MTTDAVRVLIIDDTFERMAALRTELRHVAPEMLVLSVPLTADEVKRDDVLMGAFAARSMLQAGNEPKWNLIFPRGTWHGPNFEKLGGSFTVDDAFVTEVIENWKAAGSPRLPVRWTHEHLRNVDPSKQALLDRKAANVVDLRATDAGLEGLTEWKPAGAKDLADGVFDAWSAEWAPRHINRLTGKVGGWFLSGVALTSEPYFNLMPPVAASLVEPTTPPQSTEGNTMNEEQLKALRASLGLSATATIDEVLKAAAGMRATLIASEEKLKASQTPTEVITAAVAPVKAQLETLQAELKKRDTQLLERDVKSAVESAKRGDGKLGRAINDKLVAHALKVANADGLAAAVEFLDALPATVPMSSTGVEPLTNGGLTAQAAKEKLDAIANANAKAGLTGAAAMEQALIANPELARAAQSLSYSTPKSN